MEQKQQQYETYLSVFAGVEQIHELVHCTENEHGTDDIHQGLDEDGGRQG